MSLTATTVVNAKPRPRSYKLSDQGGLYLMVTSKGYKSWRYDFRLNKSKLTYVLGSYPEMSLKEAREAHLEARKIVAEGQHPKVIKQLKQAQNTLNSKRFSTYAYDWLKKQNIVEITYLDVERVMKVNLFPFMDKKSVGDYSTLDLLKICSHMSDRDARYTAIKSAGILRRVFNEILIMGIVENNPAANLAELLVKPNPKERSNYRHITCPKEFGLLLRAIDNPSDRQDYSVTMALKLMPHLFLRPKNIRMLKWEYVDLETGMIYLPAHELKSHKPLTVPLSAQVITILEDMVPLTGVNEYVFSSVRAVGKPLSRGALNQAINKLINPETKEPFEITTHGLRHTASTLLNELGFDADLIELQLSHTDPNKIRATYNKSQLLTKRADMMSAWSSYLDGLKTNNNVIPIRRTA